MKDRRGHDNQAYFGYADTIDSTDPAGNSHARAGEGDSGPNPTPEPELTEPARHATSDSSASATPEGGCRADIPDALQAGSAVAEAPAADDAGQSTAGLNGEVPDGSQMLAQARSASADGPTPITVSEAPSGGAPAATGSDGASFVSDDMGWDMAAFAEAGGFDAILHGQMPGMGDCPGQDIFIFVDELNIDITNNTLIQETDITIIADDGGVIEIGGDFTAIQTQESIISDGSPADGLPAPDAAFLPGDVPVAEAEMAMA